MRKCLCSYRGSSCKWKPSVSFESYLPSKKIHLSWTTGQDFFWALMKPLFYCILFRRTVQLWVWKFNVLCILWIWRNPQLWSHTYSCCASWFGQVQNSGKCGFLLAEELKKWKNIFLTHGWEYAFKGGGVFSSVCFCCHPPLPGLTCPAQLPFMCFLGCFRIWSSAVLLFFLYLVSSFLSAIY